MKCRSTFRPKRTCSALDCTNAYGKLMCKCACHQIKKPPENRSANQDISKSDIY